MARTKARRRARRGRMPAGLARYWAARRGHATNPPRRRKRRRSSVRHNAPRRVRRRSYLRNAPRRRHYRRNPGLPTTGFLMDAAYVTAGFFGTRFATGFVLPMIGMGDQPLVRLAAKGAVAWGVGFLGGKFLGAKVGQLLLLGGLVEVFSDAVRTYVSPFVPALAEGNMGSYPMLSSYPTMSGNGYDSPYSVSTGLSEHDEAL